MNEIGRLGESIACRYLREEGYEIVERNYTKSWGEIDIVARKEGELYFFEVKAVSREPGRGGLDPAENIHERKMKRFSRAVNSYLEERGAGEDWRIAALLVRIDVENKRAKVAILEDVL